MKFDDNPPSGLRDVVKSKLLTDDERRIEGQRKMEDGHHRITIAQKGII